MTVLVCGDALFDFFQTAEAPDGVLEFQARFGGSPLNVAVGIARLGGKAALLTGISTDLLGNRLLRYLEAEAVRTDYVLRSDRRTTISLVGLNDQGSPSYIFYGDGSADCGLSVAELPALDDTIRGLHFGSYSIAVRPVADALIALAERHADRFISLDPNVRITIEPDLAIWRDRIDAMRLHANLIKVSAEDLGILYPGRDPAEIAEAWLSGPCSMVVVTDGGRSVEVFRKSGRWSIAPPRIEVVDAVGAGDAFMAMLLAQLYEQADLPQALETLPDDQLRDIVSMSGKAGAIVCTRRGAQLPTRADLGA